MRDFEHRIQDRSMVMSQSAWVTGTVSWTVSCFVQRLFALEDAGLYYASIVDYVGEPDHG